MSSAPMPSRVLALRRHLRYVVLFGVVLAVVAGGAFAALETANVGSYWDGLWWALSLMTTVGFVGETPETTGGRILSAVLMVSGFALLSMTTAAVASLFVREDEQPMAERESAFEQVALARLDDLSARLERIERGLPSVGGEPARDEPPAG